MFLSYGNLFVPNQQYFMSGPNQNVAPTILNIEWTNQHGCGDKDLNCNIVLQYQCRPSKQDDDTRVLRNGEIIINHYFLRMCLR